jgi:mannose-6-phosphate isomerase
MLFKLIPAIQHYDWGGFSFIPQLLGFPTSNKPCAEAWMGAHHAAPAHVVQQDELLNLNALIAKNPRAWLGHSVDHSFDHQLPFLFKVLDVRNMLSIQAHPTKSKAEAGFQRENNQGIPLNAAHRVYKDANHKPEIMVALSEFWLLHGFMDPNHIRITLKDTPELHPLLPYFAENNLNALYHHLMTMPQADVSHILTPLAERLIPLLQNQTLPKVSPHYWAARAFQDFNTTDRGIFSIFLMNIVHLKPGEAIFQDAGILHAYLEGQNIELMANSDNVFRGGLTPKHIDLNELLDNITFQTTIPHILYPKPSANPHEAVFMTPVPDFQLSSIQLHPTDTYTQLPTGPEILFLLQGHVHDDKHLHADMGNALFATPGTPYTLTATEDTTIFKASVGLPG